MMIYSWLVDHQRSGTVATETADNAVSTQEALKQHKQWLENFRRDMSLTAAAAASNAV